MPSSAGPTSPGGRAPFGHLRLEYYSPETLQCLRVGPEWQRGRTKDEAQEELMHYRGGWVHPKAVCRCRSFSTPFHFFCTNSQSLSYPDKHLMLHLLTLINSPPPAFYLILKEWRGKYPILLGKEYRFHSDRQLAFSSAHEQREAHASSWESSLDHDCGYDFHLPSPPQLTPHPLPLRVFKLGVLPSPSYMLWITKSCDGRGWPTWNHLPSLKEAIRPWHKESNKCIKRINW